LFYLIIFLKYKGHEEYHVAHSFFFQSGSVYLLLFDCSKQDIIVENKLLNWFHFLQTQIGSKTRIIMVATKIDKLKIFFQSNLKKKLNEINIGKFFYKFFVF
jgi:GTPase SAR1 family protein